MTPAQMAPVIDSAQRVAGMMAARFRKDMVGARELLGSFRDFEDLAQGALLLVELSLARIADEAGESVEESVRRLVLDLEAVMAAGPTGDTRPTA